MWGRWDEKEGLVGWKNVKDYYRITHIVQVWDGKITIGSPYVHDLIRVTLDGKVSWGNLGPSSNFDLARYYREMTADLAKLKKLIDTPDTFTADLPVYTYDGAEIIENKCEEYGWPSVTHDGMIMYNNSFYPDKLRIVAAAILDAEAGVKLMDERIESMRKELSEAEESLAGYRRILSTLRENYPEVEQ